MDFAHAIFDGEAVAAVWLISSGVGATFGRLVATSLRRPRGLRSEWTAIGGAVGCAWGFLAMVAAIASQ
jgi:hypothetical protein